MRHRLPVAPPTAAYVTVVLTTLTAFDLGHGSTYGNRCFYLHSCVNQLSDYERLLSGGNLSLSDSELEDACRKHEDISVCVRRARTTCPVGSSSYDDTWLGLNASLTYLCKDAKAEFLRHSSACFSQSRLLSSARNCNKTFHMEKEMFARSDEDFCRLTRNLLRCLYDQTRQHCDNNESAAQLLSTVVRLMRQPTLDRNGCTLGASVVTWCPLLLLISVSALLTPRVAALVT